MPVDSLSEEGRLIRQLIPLATLPYSRFQTLCEQMTVENAEDGEYLFKYGDFNTDLYYLLEGSVSLQVEAIKVETINAGGESAKFSLAHQIPRKVNVIAKGRIRYLRLNAEIMRSAQDVPYEESESYMIVDDLADDDDWMTSLLRSPIFRVLPPANLQKILMSLQEVRYKAGEVIINQGDSGDYYYIIKKGRCLISRKPWLNAKEIRLGQLTDKEAFGEDALISGEPRNVSITALSDVSLLRLGKEQFITLMKKPALKYVSFNDMQGLFAEGSQLIDVREPSEFNKFHLPRSINVPFYSLRMHFKSLNRHQAVIVVCEDGRSSETAAFILLRQRFNALVLIGGIAGAREGGFLEAQPVFSVDKAEAPSESIQVESQTEAIDLPNHDETRKLREIIMKFKNHCRVLESEKKALQQQCILLAKRLKALEAELKAVKNE